MRFVLTVLLLLSVVASAAEHVPWELTGARERIEMHRMGECSLKLLLPDGSPVPAGTLIQLDQVRHAFNFGGSLCQTYALHKRECYAAYKERFANLFNYATIGFYWSMHERRPNSWALRPSTEAVMDWAGKQGMTLRGHPLMWHNMAPWWIADTERDVKELDRDILKHVRMLVDTYPQVDQWDLHNETPGVRHYEPAHGVRRWVESCGGPGAVTRRLVNAARGVRPDSFLAVNHYSHSDPRYHEQIRYCLKNEVAFDAIGIQSHMHKKDDVWTEQQMWRMLERYAQYGKPIQLSEVTVVSCEPFADWRELQAFEKRIDGAMKARKMRPSKSSSPEWERYQAAYVRDFYTLAFSHPGVDAIIWWSVSDQDAWRGMPGGLLDKAGNPKPAYRVLDKLINHEWRTRTRGAASAQGRVSLKGFYGSYEAKVKLEGRTFAGAFNLARGATGELDVVLMKEEGTH